MARVHFSRSFSVVAAFALLLALVVPIGADDVLEVFPEEDASALAQTAPEASGDLWFVELKSAPTADGTSSVTVKGEKDAFRQNAKKANLNYTERFAFDTLWNGLAIKVDPAQISTLRRIDGVAAIYPIEAIAIPAATVGGEADLATALAMTGADTAQNTLGLSGAGVRVAIMDTGVDYDHPDLGGCFGPGCRVAVGHDFVGDAFTGANVPVQDALPDDCNGHGTHVAGIVGASGNASAGGARGVAPGVTFGAYRVFGCEGFTTADIMIAAMERALADGMNVLNMSIGSARQSWPNYPTAAASDRAVNKGMVVVASIGNSGADGAYSAGAPGVGKKVIGVASYDNSHLNVLTFIVNPGGRRVGYLPLSTTPAPPTSGTTPQIVHVGRGCNIDAYLGSPSGKVALIERGACTFQEKYQRAANAGATGVLVYNSSPGLFAGGGVTSRGIFGVAISRADGLHIRSLAAATLTWTDQRINVVNPTGNLISSFSSYGLAADLSLKPDIGAPGGLIRSTWPVEQGSYATISGTSMSSPHVAGAVALLLQARPATNANTVRSILQNSADPKTFSATTSLLDNVHRQGAGMLDIDDAVRATTLIEPGKLSLGESQAGATTHSLGIRNNSASDVTYDLSRVNALSTGGSTHSPSQFLGNASVSFAQAGVPVTSVTIPAGGSASVDATIIPATGPNRGQYGGYVVLTPQGGGQTYRVPYAGFVGDYQTITALTPTSCPVALPAIGEKGTSRFCGVGSDVPFTLPAADRSFSLAGGDVPYIVFHLDHQVRRVRIEVFDAVTNASFHLVGDFDYLGRNTVNGYSWVSWDGVTTNGGGTKIYTVPNGQYILKMSVLKALGDPADPAHTETWTSPVITIARP